MRVFVLCTGRSGSSTFARACYEGITNYTTGHETRATRVAGRFDYPDGHIEVDHRNAWFLGTLNRRFPSDVYYVHLLRDPAATAASWAVRHNRGGQAVTFAAMMVYRAKPDMASARLMVDTVTDNITEYLADKPHTTIHIEEPHAAFDRFWDAIDAAGDRARAHEYLAMTINRTGTPKARLPR